MRVLGKRWRHLLTAMLEENWHACSVQTQGDMRHGHHESQGWEGVRGRGKEGGHGLGIAVRLGMAPGYLLMVLYEELAGLELVRVHHIQQLPPRSIGRLQILPVKLLHSNSSR